MNGSVFSRIFTARRRRILRDVEATWKNEQEYRLWHIARMEQDLEYVAMPEGKRKAPPFLISYPGARTRLGRRLLAEKHAELVPVAQETKIALTV